MEYYFGVAKEKGVSEAEIGAVQSIVMAISAGRVNAQYREVRKRIGEKGKNSGVRRQHPE
jgi:hypothetical protein